MTVMFATRLALSLASVSAAVKSVTTHGYTTEGDHGHWPLAVRVASNPGHTGSVRSLDRFLPNGTESAANGGWWEIVPSVPFCFEAFGAVGDDVTDCTDALRSLGDYINLKGGGVHVRGVPGKSYVIWPDNASAAAKPAIFSPVAVRGVTVDMAGSRFHSKFLGAHNVWVFHIESSQDFTVLNFRGLDDAGIRGVGVAGQVAGMNWGAVITGSKRIKFLNCDLEGGNKGIQGFADFTAVDPNAPQDVEITGKFTNVYYAVSLQAGPHECRLDIITQGEIGRSLLAYNVTGLRGRIRVTDGVWHNQQVHPSIAFHNASPWHAKIEADLKIYYDGTASLPRTKHLAYLVMGQQDPAGGAGGGVANVKLDFDVTYPANNTNAPGLFDMDSFTVTGGSVVPGTPPFGGHAVLIEISGCIRNAIGAAADFIGLAKSAQGWTAASTGVLASLRRLYAPDIARPIVIGASVRGGVDRSVVFGGTYSREAPANPTLFSIHGEMLG